MTSKGSEPAPSTTLPRASVSLWSATKVVIRSVSRCGAALTSIL
jgi:hypothetical protein